MTIACRDLKVNVIGLGQAPSGHVVIPTSIEDRFYKLLVSFVLFCLISVIRHLLVDCVALIKCPASHQ